ncbi:hypothetical protein COCSADRAFT_235839 [Bipolaris sorokiniana ND90Pr]|uniref:Uncharacterized protein n=1 Tax=Cochliobolus sativus (strain ND90Pr / ATCC 201652) TaxID=665912 RepID=M2S0J3_COCSN|nr:uncharacterized protein COCSADRAFT_235839 [Bipolaris sorokiniana ND90Pr]EMD60778.1 hypothetical protein COCSADRAFT_235839 [Bipolaris sorokiniana ND90Pr]
MDLSNEKLVESRGISLRQWVMKKEKKRAKEINGKEKRIRKEKNSPKPKALVTDAPNLEKKHNKHKREQNLILYTGQM